MISIYLIDYEKSEDKILIAFGVVPEQANYLFSKLKTMQVNGELIMMDGEKVIEQEELSANSIFEIQEIYDKHMFTSDNELAEDLRNRDEHVRNAYYSFINSKNDERPWDFINLIMVYD